MEPALAELAYIQYRSIKQGRLFETMSWLFDVFCPCFLCEAATSWRKCQMLGGFSFDVQVDRAIPIQK